LFTGTCVFSLAYKTSECSIRQTVIRRKKFVTDDKYILVLELSLAFYTSEGKIEAGSDIKDDVASEYYGHNRIYQVY
jgi:hypothetical protein